MNISEATRKVLTKYPYLDKYMAMGVVNYRGLARTILPEIAREVGLKPNVLSIVTALRRTPTKKKQEKSELEAILAKSSVNLKYDMAAATVSLGRSDMEITKEKLLKEGTYILLQGMESLTIIADDPSIKKVREHLGNKVLEIYSNLAIVVVKSPREITKTPGVIAYLANILAIEKINVVEMMSSHAETAFIVEERDALRTIEVLRREIKRSRFIPK
jgi:predicted regulator of amino acid metabolism with ACT domain